MAGVIRLIARMGGGHSLPPFLVLRCRDESLRPMIGVVLFLTIAIGCEQSFDPRLSSEPLPIVYSIMGTDRSLQFVRVYTQYDSSASVPTSKRIEVPITDAFVSLDDGSNVTTLFDTTMIRPPDPRYQTPIHAYVTSALAVKHGGRFNLRVQSRAIGYASATVVVPNVPLIYLNEAEFFDFPTDFSEETKATINVYLQPGAKGYILRLNLCYDVMEQDGWMRKWQEIPVSFKAKPIKYEQALYAQVTKVSSVPAVVQTYSNASYRLTLGEISARTNPKKIIFNYVVLQFVQYEENLYNYYNIVSGFRDQFSLRLDQASYSNISGGTGLFGAYAVDSLVHVLPYDFIYNRR